MSVLSQPCKSVSIVLVDDGSTDGSEAICDSLAEKFGNIKVLHRANGGVSEARNAGIDASTERYICFLDSDDCLMPSFLTDERVARWESKGCDVFSYKDVNTDGKIQKQAFSASRAETTVSGGADSIWCVGSAMVSCVYEKKLLDGYGIRFYGDVAYGEDTLFRLACLYFAESIFVSDELMYLYRQHTGSAMHRRRTPAIVYYPKIVEGYMRLQNDINSRNIAEKGKLSAGDVAVGIYFTDMAKEHFERFGGASELFRAINESPYYGQFLSFQKGRVRPEQWKEYCLLREHPSLFRLKYSLRGAANTLMRAAARIPGINKLRDGRLYRYSIAEPIE